MLVMVRVRDAHFFRKVPKDVTEATKLGGILSVIAVLTIGWLVREEYALFRKVKLTTELHLDQSSMPVPLGPEHARHSRTSPCASCGHKGHGSEVRFTAIDAL